MKKFIFVTFTFVFTQFWCLALRAEIQDSGELRFETRKFKDDEVDRTIDNAMAVYTRAEIKYAKESYNATFRGYALADGKDKTRDNLTIEDLFFTYYLKKDESASLSAGYKIFNWSATEAFHPADILNSQNYDSNIEALDKIGELNIDTSFKTPYGNFSLLYLPYAQSPKYPQQRSRLGASVNLSRPVWVTKKNETDLQNWHHQGALKYSNSIGAGDLSLHAVYHLNTVNPIVGKRIVYENILMFSLPVGVEFTPYYFRALQIGGTYQYALDGGWLIKTEAAYRDFLDDEVIIQTLKGNQSPQDHGIVAVGTEYGFSMQNGGESNIVLEFQTLVGPNKLSRSELSVFQNDIMLGYRLALNDTLGREFFASLIRDIERQNETLYNFNYTQRLNDNWKIKTGFRVFDAPKKGTYATGLEAYHNAHYVFFNLSRFF